MKTVHVRFMVDIVELQQVFLQVLQFSLVKINPPLLHVHSYIMWKMDRVPIKAQSHPIITIIIITG
jgi:hypothetical protein